MFGRLAATLEKASDKNSVTTARSNNHHINEHVFDGKQARPRVAIRGCGLPLITGHVEVGAQRPPHVAGVNAGLDGLHGGPSPQSGQHMVDQQRSSPYRTELRLDEFMELRLPHATKLPSKAPAFRLGLRDQAARRGWHASH